MKTTKTAGPLTDRQFDSLSKLIQYLDRLNHSPKSEKCNLTIKVNRKRVVLNLDEYTFGPLQDCLETIITG